MCGMKREAFFQLADAAWEQRLGCTENFTLTVTHTVDARAIDEGLSTAPMALLLPLPLAFRRVSFALSLRRANHHAASSLPAATFSPPRAPASRAHASPPPPPRRPPPPPPPPSSSSSSKVRGRRCPTRGFAGAGAGAAAATAEAAGAGAGAGADAAVDEGAASELFEDAADKAGATASSFEIKLILA